MNIYTDFIPGTLIDFVVVLLLSLLIGLSQRKHFLHKDSQITFGTDRTYSLIGMLGFVLYTLQPQSLTVYMAGMLCLMLFLAAFYAYKLFKKDHSGTTSLLIALLTYTLGPLVCTQKLWVVILLVVSILILNEMKETFIKFSQKMNENEFINLAKFLIIAAVILPVLPNEEIIPGISLTPYNIWLSTVIISGFSYISYLLKRYIFNKSGLIVAGLLGGIYSSTATVVILTKKAAEARKEELGQYITAVFCSISTLYIKYFALLAIFNFELFSRFWYTFIIMFVVAGLVACYFHFFYNKADKDSEVSPAPADGGNSTDNEDKNPLEFKIAILFAILFIVFTIATHYTIQHFGTSGLKTLSVLVGVTDITPFILNLFQTELGVESGLLITAAFNAIISNNIVKMIYGIILSRKRILKPLLCGFSIVVAVNIAVLVLLV